MNISTIFIAVPAIALVAMPQAAAAQQQDAIEVVASSPMQEWQKHTTRDLNRSLRKAPSLEARRANESIVQIAFEIGPDGRAQNLRVLPGDGNRPAQRAAMFAVRNLETLDDVPIGGSGMKVLANIIFYDNWESLEKLQARLARSERERVASKGEFSQHLAIGVGPTTLDAD